MPANDLAAILAELINDPERSTIGDPRTNTVAVTFPVADAETANVYTQALTELGCQPQTNSRQQGSEAIPCYVVLYGLDDQRRLLEGLNERIDRERRAQLDTLVRARGPIPTEVMDGIRRYSRLGETGQQIANRLNDAGIVDGMRCIQWTAQKVNRALREDDAQRRAAQAQGAA